MCKAHNKHRQDSPPLGAPDAAPGVTSEEGRSFFVGIPILQIEFDAQLLTIEK